MKTRAEKAITSVAVEGMSETELQQARAWDLFNLLN
jgi:hypothetical protein